MKRVVYFLTCLMMMVVIAISCKHKDPVDPPKGGVDTIPADTIVPPKDTVPADTIPADTVPVDTIPGDTIPADTIPVDTIPSDTTSADTIPAGPDGLIHRLYLTDFVGVVTVPKSSGDDYVCEDVQVELMNSDTIAGKYKMFLSQVSFDPQMPRMDIVLDGISADEDGKLWCDSLVPVGINFFNTGYNIPVPAYEVYHLEGETYYDKATGAAYYSTSLDIKGIGTAIYLGRKEMDE